MGRSELRASRYRRGSHPTYETSSIPETLKVWFGEAGFGSPATLALALVTFTSGAGRPLRFLFARSCVSSVVLQAARVRPLNPPLTHGTRCQSIERELQIDGGRLTIERRAPSYIDLRVGERHAKLLATVKERFAVT